MVSARIRAGNYPPEDVPILKYQQTEVAWNDNISHIFFVHNEFYEFESSLDVCDTSDPEIGRLPDDTLFLLHMQRWDEEAGVTSSPIEMAECDSYRKIVKMGRRALPLIMEQLAANLNDPDHWFMALSEITGEDPVPEKDYGKTLNMAGAWLEWWRKNSGEYVG